MKNSELKSKYRTESGKIVELNWDEFIAYPFNSKLMLIDSVDSKPLEADLKAEKEKRELIDELVNKAGFSFKRANKIVSVHKNLDELKKNLDKLKFESVENDALREHFKAKKKSRKED